MRGPRRSSGGETRSPPITGVPVPSKFDTLNPGLGAAPQLRDDSAMRIGVDLGGTKIETLALERPGPARGGFRRASPREDYRATLRTIAEMVAETERQAGGEPSVVGLGMPGTISPATGLVKNANSTWLNGQKFREDLARTLGRPLR